MNHPSMIEASLLPPHRTQRMGTLMMEAGILTVQEVERVLHRQQEHGLSFGEAARELGLVNEEAVQQVLARQFEYPYLRPDESSYPPDLVAAHAPFGAQAKLLRAIRSQLMLRWLAFDRKSIAIAGVENSVGTSFLAANLAVSFAQMGKHTLLVDANFARPRQHRIFNLDNKSGLSDLLASRADLEAAVAIKLFRHLLVLPAGTIPPNPAELLGRTTFVDLIANVSLQFDVVLVDLPSFVDGAGAIEAAVRLDGTLLVARRDKTRVNDANAAASLLEQASAEMIGIVLMDA